MKVQYVQNIENVSEFVDEVIFKAIKNNASDIHFEPREDGLYIR